MGTKLKIQFIVMIVSLFTSIGCMASELHWGFIGGVNYTGLAWDQSAGSGTSASGLSGSAGIMLTLFEERFLGIRIVGLENYINASGNPGRFSGSSPTASATITYFYDQGNLRNSFGLGYGYASYASLARPYSFPNIDSATGPVVDIKISQKTGTGLFGYGQSFVPLNRSLNFDLSIMIGAGYEF